MNILLSTVHGGWPWFRQTPLNNGAWADKQYHLNRVADQATWLVVYDEPQDDLVTTVPPHRRLLFISEPPGIKHYPPNYLNQFGAVVSPIPLGGFKGRLIRQHAALPWHYGVNSGTRGSAMGWSELNADKRKTETLSIICSNKSALPFHRLRIAFVERLRARLGNKVDVFGRGFSQVGDKASAIEPYKYHIVLENNEIDHFWTEKIADAWIGGCYVFYAGCQNIGEYFDESAITSIDISRPDDAISRIESTIAHNAWSTSMRAISENRRRLFEEHNFFAVASRLIDELNPSVQNIPAGKATHIKQSQQPSPSSYLKRIVNRGLRMPYVAFRKAVPDQFRLALKLRLASRNPFLFVDFDDRLGRIKSSKGFHSQRGQDYFIDKLLGGKRKGFFVDVGANHPVRLSNTLHFENLGWSGLSFEPQEKLCRLFKEVRRTEVLPYVLGSESKDVEFATIDTDGWENALSGVSDCLATGAPAFRDKKIRYEKKKVHRLDEILLRRGIQHVDFLSIDVEGYELEVLKGLDFRRIYVELLVVENDRTPFGDQSLRDFISSQGYKHIARLSGDDVFRRRNS